MYAITELLISVNGKDQVVKGVGIRTSAVDPWAYPEYVFRIMKWVKREGRWYGEWGWEKYDRWDEWCFSDKINRQWLNPDEITSGHTSTRRFTTVRIAEIVPQEVLLCMVHLLDTVSAILYHAAHDSSR